MGCGNSLFQQCNNPKPIDNHPRRQPPGNASNLELTNITIQDTHNIDCDQTAVYRPPPPDWALTNDGVQKSIAYKVQARMMAKNGTKKSEWYRLVDDARKAAAEEMEKRKTERKDENEEIGNEMGNYEKSDEIVNREGAKDAMSRAKQVQTVPVAPDETESIELEETQNGNIHPPLNRTINIRFGEYATLV